MLWLGASRNAQSCPLLQHTTPETQQPDALWILLLTHLVIWGVQLREMVLSPFCYLGTQSERCSATFKHDAQAHHGFQQPACQWKAVREVLIIFSGLSWKKEHFWDRMLSEKIQSSFFFYDFHCCSNKVFPCVGQGWEKMASTQVLILVGPGFCSLIF